MTGELKVPVYGESEGHDVKVAYSDDFTELTADAGKFTSVDLKGYLVGALTLIGRKLKTNAMFNVTDFIVNYMAEEIASFLEGELLNGTPSKMEGALSTTCLLYTSGTRRKREIAVSVGSVSDGKG